MSGPQSTTAGLWNELDTDWLVLDCELMPWSAKAIELIGASTLPWAPRPMRASRPPSRRLKQRRGRGLDVAPLLEKQRGRISSIDHYVDAYRHYVWPVNGVADLRLAPFHILAGETGVYSTMTTAGTWSAAIDSSPRTPGGCKAPVGSLST